MCVYVTQQRNVKGVRAVTNVANVVVRVVQPSYKPTVMGNDGERTAIQAATGERVNRGVVNAGRSTAGEGESAVWVTNRKCLNNRVGVNATNGVQTMRSVWWGTNVQPA